jgi:hypothetical protein
MVAAVSHLPADFILMELPAAQGMQYQAIYLETQNQRTRRPAKRFDSPAFSEIANKYDDR